MAVQRQQLLNFINTLLKPETIKDYCPNGLQVEGAAQCERIVTGVTASQALIDAAIEAQADTLIVHHGYFWKGEKEPITGMKKRRIKALMDHDINLLAYHLPLDVHESVGNNVQLGTLMGLRDIQPLEAAQPLGVVMTGKTPSPMSAQQIKEKLENTLQRTVLHEGIANQPIEAVAWCTGGGQSFIELAAEAGVDAFISGEVSEQTIHTAREMGIHFFAAGHHATERYGVKALGELIAKELNVAVTFIDIDNPA